MQIKTFVGSSAIYLVIFLCCSSVCGSTLLPDFSKIAFSDVNKQAVKNVRALYLGGGIEIATIVLEKMSLNSEISPKIPLLFAKHFQFKDKSLEHAIRVYRAILARKSHGSETETNKLKALGLLSGALAEQGKFTETIELVESKAKNGKGTALAYFGLGKAYSSFKRSAAAYSSYLIGLALDPREAKNWELLQQEGRTLNGDKEVLEGLASFKLPMNSVLLLKFASFGKPGTWRYENLVSIVNTYEKLIKAQVSIQQDQAAENIKSAFLQGSWPILRDKFDQSKFEEVYKVLALSERIQPVSAMNTVRRKSFFFYLSAAQIFLNHYLQAAKALEGLSESPIDLLLTYKKNGKLNSHLVLKLLRMNLKASFYSVSWNPENNMIRDNDPRDFIGHPVNIDATLKDVRSNSVIEARYIPDLSEEKDEDEAPNEEKVYYLIPYGMVSRGEDLVTLATCRNEDLPKGLATSIFCGGARVFPSLLKGGPPMVEDADLEGAIAWSIKEKNFELPVKDLIVRLINTFSDTSITGKIKESIPVEEIDRLAKEIRSTGPAEVNSSTFEAFEVARISREILIRMQDIGHNHPLDKNDIVIK